jgi:hypothetical protein
MSSLLIDFAMVLAKQSHDFVVFSVRKNSPDSLAQFSKIFRRTVSTAPELEEAPALAGAVVLLGVAPLVEALSLAAGVLGAGLEGVCPRLAFSQQTTSAKAIAGRNKRYEVFLGMTSLIR